MKHKVLVASDQMRICNVLEAVRDLQEIFSICDINETGEGVHSGVGLLSPININKLSDSDADKIQRMQDWLQAVYAKRKKWVLS